MGGWWEWAQGGCLNGGESIRKIKRKHEIRERCVRYAWYVRQETAGAADFSYQQYAMITSCKQGERSRYTGFFF